MFSKDDFKIESLDEIASLALIAPFLVLIAPFLIASYTLGFCADMVGWMET